MQTVLDLLKRGRGDPSPTVEKRCKSVGDGASTSREIRLRNGGSKPPPYGREAGQIVGEIHESALDNR